MAECVEISIIIINFHTTELINNLLIQLSKLGDQERRILEILVVDNSIDVCESTIINPSDISFKLFQGQGNIGFSRANNLASRTATGRFLLFLNPDVIFQTVHFGKIVAAFNNNPTIGVLSPLINNTKGSIQKSSFGHFPGIVESIKELFFIDAIAFRLLNASFNRARFVDWVSGTMFFIRKDLFDALAGFDEKIFMYFEDVDLCFRVRKNGYRVFIDNQSSVIHLGGIYSNNNYSSVEKSMVNKYYFLKKNKRPLIAIFSRRIDIINGLVKYLFWKMLNNKVKMKYYKTVIACPVCK